MVKSGHEEDLAYADVALDDYDEDDVSLAVDVVPSSNDKWIINSRSSSHVCPIRDYFTTYDLV